MPVQICLLGDSHAAALRQGWARIQSGFADIEITFFAAMRAEWPSLGVADRKLVPQSQALREQFERSSKGSHEIAVTYEAYIVCGLGLAISFPLRLVTHNADNGWDEYREAVARHIRDTPCAKILANLRQVTDAPILVLASPHQPLAFCRSSPLLTDSTAWRLQKNFNAACETLAREHAARFISQPEETLSQNRVTTRMEFSNYTSNSEREDRRHCNAGYGAIVMRHVLQSLGVAASAD